MSFVQPARMRRLACFGVQHNGSHISSSSSHWCAGLRSLGIFLFSRNHPCLWGTHLWLVLWCALGLMIPIFVWFSRTYPPAFIVCTTAICTLDWLTLGLKYSHIFPGRSVLRLDCGYRQQYTQRHLAHRIVVRMVAQ